MLAKVVQVKPNLDFTVHVYFYDGKVKLFDVKPFLHQGVFKKISELSIFLEKCTVMNGTLAWDIAGGFNEFECIDIDPETIYKTGKDVADPLAKDIA